MARHVWTAHRTHEADHAMLDHALRNAPPKDVGMVLLQEAPRDRKPSNYTKYARPGTNIMVHRMRFDPIAYHKCKQNVSIRMMAEQMPVSAPAKDANGNQRSQHPCDAVATIFRETRA